MYFGLELRLKNRDRKRQVEEEDVGSSYPRNGWPTMSGQPDVNQRGIAHSGHRVH